MTVQTRPDTELLLRRDHAGVAWLMLNRPQARNALSAGLMAALDAALVEIGRDASVRVVVIGGAGPAFCAGHDLREIRANPGAAAYAALFAECS
ncbi:MAG: enoyl-CoA hydratase/isomerase family protein, partial [Rhodospirillales bacterium]|nr:enoyl-CoA hydratase/isomerase family protein [Rhodospirillales bacterium]